MSCGRCGADLREGAKFCARCGAPVTGPVVQRAEDARIADLQAGILAIAGAIHGVDARRAALLAALAAEPAATAIGTVVVGDAGRGRTSVATLLAAAAAVTTVSDLPALTDPAFDLDDVLRADVVVITLSATQLLSGVERAALLERVLPRCVGAAALAVTRMDAVETDEDRADLDRRLARFVEQAGRELPIFGVRRGAAGGLTAWVTDAATAAAGDRLLRWARRVRVALDGVAELPIGPAGPDRATIEAAIRAEGELAFGEAQAHLREGLATLRATLPDRLAAMPADRLRAEAATVLTHEVERLTRDVAAAYLGQLERSLLARHDEISRAAGVGLAAGAAGEAAKLTPEARAPQVAGSRPRNAASMALGAAGLVTLAAVGGPVGLASGAAMLYGAWAVRKDQQAKFEATLAEDTRAAVRAWLDEVERELGAHLAQLAAEILGRLVSRAAALVPDGPSMGPAELGAKVAEVREGLARS